MSWFVIVNPAAGARRDTEGRVRAALAERRVAAHVVVTRGSGHVAELVDEGWAAGHYRFVAVGGDGTANEVADALLRRSWTRRPVLAILPAGTGSDFIRTFGRSQRLEESIKHLEDDETYPIDVGHITGPWGDRYFINVAEAGLGAGVVRAARHLPVRLGPTRYKLAIWPTLLHTPRPEIVVSADDRRYEGPAVMVVMANGQFFGGGMNVAPKAALVDGKLDVQVFTGPRRLALVLQPRVVRGTHLGHPSVRRMTGSKVTISSSRPWPVEADGEYLGKGPVTVSVLAGALEFKV